MDLVNELKAKSSTNFEVNELKVHSNSGSTGVDPLD
jgi:hypothetical protein